MKKLESMQIRLYPNQIIKIDKAIAAGEFHNRSAALRHIVWLYMEGFIYDPKKIK